MIEKELLEKYAEKLMFRMSDEEYKIMEAAYQSNKKDKRIP